MDDETEIEFTGWQVVGLAVILFLVGFLMGNFAAADEPEVTVLTVSSTTPDFPKLEAKCVAVVRKWDPTLTLAAARDIFLIGAKDAVPDHAKCRRYIVMNALEAITQMEILLDQQQVVESEKAAVTE